MAARISLDEELRTAVVRDVARRHFLKDCGVGLGRIALASLLGPAARSASAAGLANPAEASHAANPHPLAPRPPHFAPRAKRVIQLFMAGAPSQLDLFDEKPALVKFDGRPVPAEVVKGQRYAFIERNAALLAPRFKFARHGQSGASISEMLPHLGGVADKVAIVRSMTTDAFNHAPAQIFMNTGSQLPGRPCLGSWAVYGLGSEAEDLPAFVVLNSAGGLSGGAANYSCGFLPTVYQGVMFRGKGDPILNVSNPPGVDARMQRETIDLVNELNRRRLAETGDPEIAARVANYEMAFRMQSSAPELMDLASESQETLDLYGAKPGQASFANNCLLARRLLERGVRFVTCYHEAWDHHSDVAGGLKTQCGLTDRAAAALVIDLERRGLLEDTLVVWGGEFGRTPMVESNAALGRSLGRDHHPQAFTMWLAGGGVKPGLQLGATDEIGFHVVEDPVHVHDLHATLLHLLGFDHERLTYRAQGRDFRLTDVFGNVVTKLLA